MSFSLIPLLIADPSLPVDTREALQGVHLASDRCGELRARERAAHSLVRAFGLSWSDARDLVELPDDRSCGESM
jgi:hypothetical protein